MTHNSAAVPVSITLQEQRVWAAFDALPKLLRDEIAHAAFEYDTTAILEDYRAYVSDNWVNASPQEYLTMMRRNFQADLRKYSPTDIENGKYRLERRNIVKKTVNVYGRSQSVRKDFQALR